ncbi:MAG TPA: heat-shock protein Hsp20 [Moraxellaceae bacterium]|nr:heat-shock protein Hsp20 [Moraxellaceae bacterium]
MSALIPRGGLFDELFRDFGTGFSVRPLHGNPLPSPDKIKLDVSENGNAYTVTAEIPGVAKEDIHVSVEGNTVTLRAEVKQHDRQEKESAMHSERYYGSISRTFQLPVDIDEAQSSAKSDNGVLVLTLIKKKPGNGSRRLTVQ